MEDIAKEFAARDVEEEVQASDKFAKEVNKGHLLAKMLYWT